MATQSCRIDRTTPHPGVPMLTLSNGLISVTVLPEKGADIYALTYEPLAVDILWKSPLGLRGPHEGRFAADSVTAWMEQYEGGWQECFPNGGDPCTYQGLELSFHGEASLLPWQLSVSEESPEAVDVAFSVRLYRSPFSLTRQMRLEAGSPTLHLREMITNHAGEPMEFMWGHHPAYGPPFISEATRLQTNARSFRADTEDLPHNPLEPGSTHDWPWASARDGRPCDLSAVPREPRALLGYLSDFDGPPWYALLNPQLGLGVGWAWSAETFPYLWLWQELSASGGYPFYKRTYTMAVEPWSSYPAHGLANVIRTTGTQLHLAAGATCSAQLAVSLFPIALGQSVDGVDAHGRVLMSKG